MIREKQHSISTVSKPIDELKMYSRVVNSWDFQSTIKAFFCMLHCCHPQLANKYDRFLI